MDDQTTHQIDNVVIKCNLETEREVILCEVPVQGVRKCSRSRLIDNLSSVLSYNHNNWVTVARVSLKRSNTKSSHDNN